MAKSPKNSPSASPFEPMNTFAAPTRKQRAFYIQRKDARYLETVDEFKTRKEALAMLAEYRLSDRSAHYYLSTRPCRDWNNR